MADRRNLAVQDTYHTVLKMLATAKMVTLTEYTERILYKGIMEAFDEDPTLVPLVKQLVGRDEKDDQNGNLRERTLRLIARILAGDPFTREE
jgi:hypothetical protein